MTPIFAQLESVPSEWLKNLVLTIAGLAAVVFYGKEIFGGAKKREVSFSETPASKKEFDQHVAETRTNFAAIRAELAADRHTNQVHASERSKTLFSKMESTRTELDAKLDDTRRELSEKIDGMEQRIIATLKNTGAI